MDNNKMIIKSIWKDLFSSSCNGVNDNSNSKSDGDNSVFYECDDGEYDCDVVMKKRCV